MTDFPNDRFSFRQRLFQFRRKFEKKFKKEFFNEIWLMMSDNEYINIAETKIGIVFFFIPVWF